MVVRKLRYVADTELQGDAGKDLLTGAPETPVSIDDKASDRVADLVPEDFKHGLSVLSSLARGKAGNGDVLSGSICSDQKRIMIALNEDGFPIEQEIATPGRLELLGHL